MHSTQSDVQGKLQIHVKYFESDLSFKYRELIILSKNEKAGLESLSKKSLINIKHNPCLLSKQGLLLVELHHRRSDSESYNI